MTAPRLIAFSLALMCGATVAHAQQTVISRQISEEPVETIVTQGPYGTVITRRPLETTYQRIVPSGYGTVTVRSVGVPTVAVVESDDDAVETVTVRRTRTVIATTPARRTVRTVRRGTPPVMARAVEPDDEDEPRPAQVRRVRTVPLALQPAQREIIYRTIVRERVYAPAPQPVVAYPTPAYDYAYTTPSYGYAYAPRPVTYTVGTAVPQTIQLASVPARLAVQVPATRGYQYAVVNNRVLLIDPVTGIIVADVTP